MDIAIYGAGSLGTVVGAFLTRAGLDVDLITRNKKHVEGLRQHSAQIIGTLELTVPVKALLPEQMDKTYDLIFLLTKQTDNESAVHYISRYLKKDGAVCTMQNGLPEYRISEIIGEDKTFGCSVAWGATLIGNGVCELTSDPHHLTFNLGQLGICNREKLAQIKKVLECLGPVEIEENFIGARWAKLLINSSFSGLSAVLGCTFGEVARNKQSRLCAQRIIKECIDVARRAHIKIEPVQGKDLVKLFDYSNRLKEKLSNFIIPFAIRKHRLLKSSMLQDLEKGKKTEVESINGTVREFGKKYNVPTPFNNLVIELIHKIESGALKPSFENLVRFNALTENRRSTT